MQLPMIRILLKPGGKAIRFIAMKKDSELPWVTRILRWGLAIIVLAYSALCVVEKAKEVF